MTIPHVLSLFIANLASILSVAAAFMLANNGHSSWGWFLFVAILLQAQLKIGSNDKRNS